MSLNLTSGAPLIYIQPFHLIGTTVSPNYLTNHAVSLFPRPERKTVFLILSRRHHDYDVVVVTKKAVRLLCRGRMNKVQKLVLQLGPQPTAAVLCSRNIFMLNLVLVSRISAAWKIYSR